MRDDIDNAKEEITAKLVSGIPRAEICKQFRCKPETLTARLKKWGINDLKNPQRKGRPHYEQRTPAADYLNTDRFLKSHVLRLKLIEEGYKEKRCETCKKTRWNGKEIPLELHHINRNRFDNRLENLLILCPNCHAQQ